MNQDGTRLGGVPWSKPHCARWGPSSPPPKRGQSPPAQFLADLYCCQTAGCIKMPLGMEVGLGPGDFVFDGDPATPRTEGTHHHPVFGPCSLRPNGWMDEDATWYGSRPRPRPHCIKLAPSSARNGHRAPILSGHVYCGHGRPSQLLLSSCLKQLSQTAGFSVVKHSTKVSQ